MTKTKNDAAISFPPPPSLSDIKAPGGIARNGIHSASYGIVSAAYYLYLNVTNKKPQRPFFQISFGDFSRYDEEVRNQMENPVRPARMQAEYYIWSLGIKWIQRIQGQRKSDT